MSPVLRCLMRMARVVFIHLPSLFGSPGNGTRRKKGFERLKAEGKVEGEYTMPGPVVLCLDDVPNAALALQETPLSPIFDRQLGDSGCTLLDNVKIILTGAREGVRLEMVDRYGFLRELNRPALQQEEAVTEGRSVRCR